MLIDLRAMMQLMSFISALTANSPEREEVKEEETAESPL